MVVRKDEAIQREVAPGVFQIHYLDKHSGAGGVSMGHVTLQPGAALRVHTHTVEDAMVVVEGNGTFVQGDEEHAIEQGMALLAPAGVPHGLKNDSNGPLRIVYTWPSVDVERFFIE